MGGESQAKSWDYPLTQAAQADGRRKVIRRCLGRVESAGDLRQPWRAAFGGYYQTLASRRALYQIAVALSTSTSHKVADT